MHSTPAIQVLDLWMSFPGKQSGEEIHVLERINLDVRAWSA